MTIRVSGGGSTFTNLRISSGGSLCFIGSNGTGDACFTWVDPDTLLLKILGSTAHSWTGDYVPPASPSYTGIPMGIGLAITYPE
jgi:hypothetical protein